MHKAFDSTGHSHLFQTLDGNFIPDNFKGAIKNLYFDVTTLIEVGNGRPEFIPVRRGVIEDDPLSPFLFNLAIKFLLKEWNIEDMKRNNGSLVEKDLVLCAFAFADDLVPGGKDRESLTRITERAMQQLSHIGITVNPSTSISRDLDGRFSHLGVNNNSLLSSKGGIPAVDADNVIEYLGVKLRHDSKWTIKSEIATFSEKLKACWTISMSTQTRNYQF